MGLEDKDTPELFRRELDSPTIEACKDRAKRTISPANYGNDNKAYMRALETRFHDYLTEALERRQGQVPVIC